MTTQTGSAERGAGLPTLRSSRSARKILVAVVVSALTILGLAAWVILAPYESTDAAVTGGQGSVSCEAKITTKGDVEGRRVMQAFHESCDHARSSRRTTALLIGAGVATVACAASTWPSKRLTGEALGPVR